MSHPSNRRKSRLVDRPLQFGLAWRLMIIFVLFCLGGIALAFAPSMIALATRRELSALEPAAGEFLVLHKRIWPAALFIFGGVFVYTVYFSHRIAGPIYRINGAIRQMIEGRYPDAVTLRQGDYFRETADLVESLSRKLARERETPPAGSGAPGEERP